jgi:hypothetical protein
MIVAMLKSNSATENGLVKQKSLESNVPLIEGRRDAEDKGEKS